MTRYAKRTDSNQAEIVDYLRAQGYQVVLTNMGNDFPDLLVGNGHEWSLMEVKSEQGSLDRGQLRFLAEAQAPAAVVTNAESALRMAKVPRIWRIITSERDAINVWLIRHPEQNKLSVRKFFKLIGRTA